MKDIKRRSFLKSIIGGVTALFVGVPKAKTKQGASPIYPAYYGWLEDNTELPGGGLNEVMFGDKPWTNAQDEAFMQGDQWKDELKRMLKQQRRTIDELCINAIKGNIPDVI